MADDKKKAVVLLSGGLDSTTVLGIAQQQGFETYALSFDYGQQHRVELDSAKQVALAQGAKQHVIAKIDLRMFGGSALTSEIPVPKNRKAEDLVSDIPITYVPARNTVFLSFALAWAEVIGTGDIFLGVNALDYSGYPDCRPEYIKAFQNMANLATKASTIGQLRYTIHTPLISLSKREIIQQGLALGINYGETSSCYDPSPSREACGECDSCLLRLKGFSEAGAADPIAYKTHGDAL
jgi:7-cyano-7-deazaguanine synthase